MASPPKPSAQPNLEQNQTTPPERAPSPVCRLARCLVRPYHPSDASALAQAANSPDVARHMTDLFPSPYTLRDAEDWISTAPPLNYGIFTRYTAEGDELSSPILVGAIGIRGHSAPGVVEVGYWLGREFWGRGLATETLQGFSRWAFTGGVSGLRRLEATVYSPNWRSAAVLSRSGFTFEGIKRKAATKAGVPVDVMMFGLLKEECAGIESAVFELPG